MRKLITAALVLLLGTQFAQATDVAITVQGDTGIVIILNPTKS